MKDAYYFPHDSNAQHDEKILVLRTEFGWEGYGIYWAIIEKLRESTNYRYSCDSIFGLSLGLSHPLDRLDSLVKLCISIGLLEEKDGYFHSPSLTKRMQEIDNKREKFREYGRLGGLKYQATLKPASSHPKALKERKVKESKVNINADSLFEEFYERYPNKKGKLPALKAFLKLNPNPQVFDSMISALEEQKQTHAWLKDNGQFIPMPSTWINQRRWEDEIKQYTPTPASFILRTYSGPPLEGE